MTNTHSPTSNPKTPHPWDVEQLRHLLDITEGFTSNDQRARYLLSSNWMRDRNRTILAALAEVRAEMVELDARTQRLEAQS